MSYFDRAIITVGQGWDLHRLVAGGPLRLAGVDIPHDSHAHGHSDGDVVLHALTDAILGALGAGDIGQHFSDSDPRWSGADSDVFIAEAVRLMRAEGLALGRADVTVILERPKLAPHRDTMRKRVAECLGSEEGRVSIKAKTNEGLGGIGAGKAIAALAIVGLVAAD